MARRVFFSFHFERDIWRANQVRNSWVTQDRQAAGFWDASLWEEAKKKGDAEIKKMIDEGLKNTSVTVVLIGAETASRTYVQYEIEQSVACRNGLLGVRIHSLKNQAGNTDTWGSNPFDNVYEIINGIRMQVSQRVKVYDWSLNEGYTNFGDWVEQAAKDVGR